jgi:methyl-accepting chemotaxis protein
MVIYANNGFILSHSYADRVGKMMQDVDVEYGEHRQAVFKAIQYGDEYQGKLYDPEYKTNMILNMRSFQIGNSDVSWSIMIGTAESYVLKEVNEITRFTIILSAIFIVISAVIVYFFLAYITKPIVTVTETLKDISEGEGDLTRTIAVNDRNDEITELSKYFNKTLEKIKNLIIAVKSDVVTLHNTGNELSSSMTETAAAINQITANIQSIKTRITNQSESVAETNVAMKQIKGNIDKLNEHVGSQSESVSQSSSAIEEMLANIGSVTNTLVKNSENVKELSFTSEDGRNDMKNAAFDIEEITRQSEGLLEINAVMKNIASQTNLLSMNAAIEAAHAGEAGKGFAVVAAEIRKLAENSSEQSKTIGSVLKKIKESIDKISESTGNVLEKFEAINSGIKTVTDQEEHIRYAMEEQNQGSKQILEAVSKLNKITNKVKESSHEMLAGSNNVIEESKKLDIITNEITSGMDEMATGADEINAAIHMVNDTSTKNRENIERLVREVSKFKVD